MSHLPLLPVPRLQGSFRRRQAASTERRLLPVAEAGRKAPYQSRTTAARRVRREAPSGPSLHRGRLDRLRRRRVAAPGYLAPVWRRVAEQLREKQAAMMGSSGSARSQPVRVE